MSTFVLPDGTVLLQYENEYAMQLSAEFSKVLKLGLKKCISIMKMNFYRVK